MAGRSLWSVLMVAWLSAGNASMPPVDATMSNIPVTEQERAGDAPQLCESTAPDDAAASAASESAATRPA